MRNRGAIIGGVLGLLNVSVHGGVALSRLMAVGRRGRIRIGLFAQHASGHRAPDGEQYGKQYQ